MILLLLTLIAFAVVHLAPAVPRYKAAAKARLGKAYGALYGLASLLLLAAAIWALRAADAGPLYDVPAWGRHANYLLTLIAFIFVGIFLFRGSWRNSLRFPMALATTFWATGHLLANGDTRTTLFFAGFLVIGLVHAWLLSLDTTRPPSDERAGHNFMSVIAGLALYGVMVQLHEVLIGVPVFNLAAFSH
ncbi:MAG: NnrU family protein [Hyphomicrobiales bacterium]